MQILVFQVFLFIRPIIILSLLIIVNPIITNLKYLYFLPQYYVFFCFIIIPIIHFNHVTLHYHIFIIHFPITFKYLILLLDYSSFTVIFLSFFLFLLTLTPLLWQIFY